MQEPDSRDLGPRASGRAELVAERLELVRRLLGEHDAPAALLRTRPTFAWATAGGENHVVQSTETGVAALLVSQRDARVVTAVNEAARLADEELAGLGIEVEPVPWHDPSAIDEAARRLAGSDPVDDVALESAIRPRRSVLAPLEAERMRWLAQRTVEAVDAALAAVEAGQAEHEVAARVTADLVAAGARVPVVLVAADERIARYRHPLPSDAAIRRRVMLVAMPERWGLHVAVTRLRELEPLPDDLARRTAAVGRILDAMLAATRPGVTHGEVLEAARAAYAAEGFAEEWALHHQGGTIGYRGREVLATPGATAPILPGMAVAWNPSITGTKAEETAILTDDGLQVITR